MRTMSVIAVAAMAAMGTAAVFPTTGHSASNYIPFGGGNVTAHQVFASSLFGTMTGGLPASITSIGFAPGLTGTFNLGEVTINLGYTTRIPGVLSGSGGLSVPIAGGGGGPNANGPMTTFYTNPATSFTFTTFGSDDFQMVFNGAFVYDPNAGNLLVEFVVPNAGNLLHVSRSSGSAESSRAYTSSEYGDSESTTTATRMDFTFTAVPEPASIATLALGALALLRKRRR